MLDTKHVPRRTLRFETPAELRRELDRLEAAQSDGALVANGNWAPGRIFSHLAAWIEYAYQGYPMRPALPLRLIARLFKRRFLTKPMPAGTKIPRAPEGTYGADEAPFEPALARLRAAWDRLEREPPTSPNPLLGPCTPQEWIALHLRHAELHLSYLDPGASRTRRG